MIFIHSRPVLTGVAVTPVRTVELILMYMFSVARWFEPVIAHQKPRRSGNQASFLL